MCWSGRAERKRWHFSVTHPQLPAVGQKAQGFDVGNQIAILEISASLELSEVKGVGN
jgi:hypothetical protein